MHAGCCAHAACAPCAPGDFLDHFCRVSTFSPFHRHADACYGVAACCLLHLPMEFQQRVLPLFEVKAGTAPHQAPAPPHPPPPGVAIRHHPSPRNPQQPRCCVLQRALEQSHPHRHSGPALALMALTAVHPVHLLQGALLHSVMWPQHPEPGLLAAWLPSCASLQQQSWHAAVPSHAPAPAPQPPWPTFLLMLWACQPLLARALPAPLPLPAVLGLRLAPLLPAHL
mmetsp:Transcript_6647/g.19149  ORF Transcript_6647/g.19149 Transcript_6647/m.19149 type:complete len:226 (+) Transcript_6647:542-1219(+)